MFFFWFDWVPISSLTSLFNPSSCSHFFNFFFGLQFRIDLFIFLSFFDLLKSWLHHTTWWFGGESHVPSIFLFIHFLVVNRSWSFNQLRWKSPWILVSSEDITLVKKITTSPYGEFLDKLSATPYVSLYHHLNGEFNLIRTNPFKKEKKRKKIHMRGNVAMRVLLSVCIIWHYPQISHMATTGVNLPFHCLLFFYKTLSLMENFDLPMIICLDLLDFCIIFCSCSTLKCLSWLLRYRILRYSK